MSGDMGYGPYTIVGLVVAVLDIIAIGSVLLGRSSASRKLLWTLVVLVLPFLGMILYFIFGRSGKDAQL